MLRLLVVALALAGGTLVSQPASAAGGQPEQAAWHDGPCTDNVGITIVVDFADLGGGVNVRCAPGQVANGLDALDQADIAWEGARRFPSVVCRIAGAPGPDVEPCNNTPPADAYWSYWMAPRGGAWCYSTLGAGSRVPPPGSIEGWSFSSSSAQPPRFEVPAAIDGQAPNPIRPGDCGSPASGTSTTTTAASTTTTSTAAAAPPPSISETPVSPTPAPTTTARPPRATTTTLTAPPATSTTTPTSTTTTPGTSTSSSTTSSTSSTSTSTTSSTSTTVPTSTSAEPSVPLGTVDLSDDGQDGGGFGAATAAGIVSVGGLAGTAIWIARRRRIVP